MVTPAGAGAQTLPDAIDHAFVGVYAGPEAGLHEHHVYIDETDVATGETRGRYYRAWGFGGGAFAGGDLALTQRIRVGVEGGVSVGGRGPRADFADGSFYAARPRYGFRATAKAGYVLAPRLLAYGTFGYGGHRYRVRASADFGRPDDWGSSFTVGGGAEYRLSRQVGVRIDFRHLDNQMSHLLVGLPIRF